MKFELKKIPTLYNCLRILFFLLLLLFFFLRMRHSRLVWLLRRRHNSPSPPTCLGIEKRARTPVQVRCLSVQSMQTSKDHLGEDPARDQHANQNGQPATRPQRTPAEDETNEPNETNEAKRTRRQPEPKTSPADQNDHPTHPNRENPRTIASTKGARQGGNCK